MDAVWTPATREGGSELSENSEKQKGRLALAQKYGIKVFNNPVGVAVYDKHHVSYGLRKGFTDQVGWRPMVVTPEMVGHKIAVFVGIEWKEDGKYPQPEQKKVMQILHQDGAITGVARKPKDALQIVTRWDDERKTKDIS